ncbi:MAG: glycosyltransferase family 61 protein [Janthinobacterium lividum]
MTRDLSSDGVNFGFKEETNFRVHSTHVGRYQNQFVFGFHHLHALVSRDGVFNCQEIDNYGGRLAHYLAHTPSENYIVPDIKIDGSTTKVSFRRLTDANVIELDGPIFFGSPIEPANWGMWLLNALPSAYAFVASGQVGRFLCYAPAEWQKKLLFFMGVNPEKLIDQAPWKTYFCSDIALHQYSMIDLVPDEVARGIYQNIISRSAQLDQASYPEKIFVSRRTITRKLGGKYRSLVNEDQLLDALVRDGYTVVEPELLPFDEQVRIFSNARTIIGLGGAAMFNAVFAAPRTKLISIESTSGFALNHARLFSSLDLDYGFIFGQPDLSVGMQPHNPWSLKVPEAMQAIRRFS